MKADMDKMAREQNEQRERIKKETELMDEKML